MTSEKLDPPVQSDPADRPDPALQRRRLLRGGAVLAGAAGLTAIGSALAPSAEAADGDPVRAGLTTNATTTTTLELAASATPTLALRNADGPSLALQPLAADWEGPLAVGEIANTEIGPYLGVDQGGTATPTILATGQDLAQLALPVAITPVRLLDTRNAAGREGIVRRSSGALDSSFRLRAGAWIDIALAPADGDTTVDAAFLNVTVTGSLSGGYITAYPPGTRPLSSTLNYAKAQTIANGAFVQVGVAGTAFVVRLFASATTHVLADLTGATVAEAPGPAAAVAAQRAKAVRRRITRRPTSNLGRAGR